MGNGGNWAAGDQKPVCEQQMQGTARDRKLRGRRVEPLCWFQARLPWLCVLACLTGSESFQGVPSLIFLWDFYEDARHANETL